MRDFDSDTIAALAQRRLVRRNLLWITAKPFAGGDPVSVGLWDDAGNISLDVIDGDTGDTVTRAYLGSGRAVAFDAIPLTSDLSVRTVTVTVSQLDDTVNDFLRANNLRLAPAQIHRCLFDPDTMVPVAAAIPRFLGFVSTAPISEAAVGQQSSCVLSLVSHTRELTRIGTEKRSDASQQRRHAGDRMYQYTDVVGDWALFWGENKGVVPTSGGALKSSDDQLKKFLGIK